MTKSEILASHIIEALFSGASKGELSLDEIKQIARAVRFAYHHVEKKEKKRIAQASTNDIA